MIYDIPPAILLPRKLMLSRAISFRRSCATILLATVEVALKLTLTGVSPTGISILRSIESFPTISGSVLLIPTSAKGLFFKFISIVYCECCFFSFINKGIGSVLDGEIYSTLWLFHFSPSPPNKTSIKLVTIFFDRIHNFHSLCVQIKDIE